MIKEENPKNEEKEESAREVIETLNKIKNDYLSYDNISAPDSLNLEKAELPKTSEEELMSLAKESVNLKYKDKEDTLNESFKSKIDKEFTKAENAKIIANDKSNSITEKYDSYETKAKNNALKKGLARSSIIIGQLENINFNKASELQSVLDNLNQTLSDSQNNISKFEAEQIEALNSLNIKKANELENRILKEKEAYKKAVDDVIKFNNNIDKLEAEYKLKVDKQKQSHEKTTLENISNYGQEYLNKEINTKQYAYLKNYLDSMDAEKALNVFLLNTEFKDIIGNEKYKELYKYLISKL